MKANCPRITITQRHTGRFYIGLDLKAFVALYGMVITNEELRKLYPYIYRPGDPLDHDRQRLVAAIKTAVEKIRAAANPVPNSQPSTPQPSTKQPTPQPSTHTKL